MKQLKIFSQCTTFWLTLSFNIIVASVTNAQGNWQEVHKQHDSWDFYEFAGFGGEIDVDGNFAVIGLELSNSSYLGPAGLVGGNASGSAIIFNRNGGNGAPWTQVTNLLRTDMAAYDYFGCSTALSGDYALVGAYGDDDFGSMSGSAYIFAKGGGGVNDWDVLKKLTPADAGGNKYFGLEVSLSGEWALIGSERSSDHGSNSGSAYLFHKDQGGFDNWGEVKELHAPDAGMNDYFGRSVKIIGDLAFVGAPGDHFNRGAVYIFQRDEGGLNNWGFLRKISFNNESGSPQLGTLLSVSGDRLLIGGIADAGKVALFERNAGGVNNWGQVKTFLINSAFGNSIALSGDNVFIGALSSSSGVAWYQKDMFGQNNWGYAKSIKGSTASASSKFGNTLYALENELFVFSLVERSIYFYNFTPQPPGISPSTVETIATQYTINDSETIKLFENVAIIDPDLPSQNLLITVSLANTQIGQFSGFITQNAGTKYFYGSSAEALTALQNLSFIPAQNLTAVGGTTNSSLTITIEDGITPPVVYNSEITTTSINQAPTVANQQFTLDLAQSPVAGSLVGQIVASDSDPGQQLTYEIIGGNTGNHFQINSTGQLRLSAASFGETEIFFALTIAVSDNATPSGQSTATIEVKLANNIFQLEKIHPLSYSVPQGASLKGAITNSIAAVGDAYDNQSGWQAGAVYIYYKDLGGENNWGLSKKVNSPSANAFFGQEVFVQDDLVFVSAMGDDEIAEDAGAVYILQKDLGGTDQWGTQKKLILPTLAAGANFGSKICVSGDTLIVSAPADDELGTTAGAVYIFARNLGGENQWGLVTKLLAENGDSGDYFGAGLGVSKGTFYVTANGDEGTDGLTRGTIHFYSLTGGLISKTSQINIAQYNSSTYRALACAIDGNTFVYADVNYDPNGAAFIYERNTQDNSWTLQKTIADNVNGGGYRIALKNNALIYCTSGGVNTNVYNRNWGGQNNWGMMQQIPTYLFIGSINLSDSHLIISGRKATSSNGRPTHIYSIQTVIAPEVVLEQVDGISMADNETAMPFENVNIVSNENSVSLRLTIDNVDKGTFTSYDGFVNEENTLTITGDITSVGGALRALIFTPVANRVLPGVVENCLITVASLNENGEVSAVLQEIVISITSINDAPTFTITDGLTVSANAGPYQYANFASELSDVDAGDQPLAFHLSVDNEDLFEVLPSISASGTLTFTPNSNLHGVATIEVYLTDNATENNSSAVQTFSITTLQSPVFFIMPSITATRNNEIVVPVQVQHFDNVLGLQFSMTWDPSIAEFLNIELNELNGLELSDFNLSNVAEGQLTIAWAHPFNLPQSLSDNDTIFSLRMLPVGMYGASSVVSITDQPTPIEVVSTTYEIIPTDLQAGLIEVSPSLLIHGTIHDSDGNALNNIAVSLSGSSIAETFTQEAGEYDFTVTPQEFSDQFTVAPLQNADPDFVQSIDVADVILIRRHILNIEPLSSPFEMIAGDVNKNAAVSIADLLLMQSVILGITESFPNNLQWTFVDAAHEFSNPADPFPYPEAITPGLELLEQGASSNFIGVRLGDLSALQTPIGGRLKTSEVIMEIGYPQQVGESVYEVELKTYGFSELSGYQFTIEFDPKSLEWISASESLDGTASNLAKLSDGLVTVMWDHGGGKSLSLPDKSNMLKLTFRKLTQSDGFPLNINGKITPVKAINNKLQLVDVDIRRGEEVPEPLSGIFMPNPFSTFTKIALASEEDETGTLEIFDANSKLIRTQTIPITKNWNEHFISAEGLVPGVYIFKFQLKGQRVIEKMIKTQ